MNNNSENTGFGFSSFPEHMTKYKDMEFQDAHINPQGDTFPESLLLMIKLLVEDEEVWNIIHQQELDRRTFAEEFEEKWELLHVMVDLLESKYSVDDLSYIRLGPKCGVGGPGRVVSVENDMYNKCEWEEDSY